MATDQRQIAAPVSDEVLEDRLAGLLAEDDGGLTVGDLRTDLAWALTRLVAGTARVHPDCAGFAVEGLIALIRPAAIRAARDAIAVAEAGD